MTLPAPPAWQCEDGLFPFGQPNTPRPARWEGAGTPRHLLVGVYPSALHVRWTAPKSLPRPAGARGVVGSMAVDIEPRVFWDGRDSADRVERWKIDVGFVDGDDGHGHATAAVNGPSGEGMEADYLTPLGFTWDDTVLLDVYPVYFVKRATAPSDRREQGDAIDVEYNPLASVLPPGAHRAMPESHLPDRPQPRDLPGLAIERFGSWLLDLLREVRPDHVATLGEEARAVLSGLPGVEASHPSPSVAATKSGGYGVTGTLRVDGHESAWTPLAHPAAIRQRKAHSGGPTWAAVHSDWIKGRT